MGGGLLRTFVGGWNMCELGEEEGEEWVGGGREEGGTDGESMQDPAKVGPLSC